MESMRQVLLEEDNPAKASSAREGSAGGRLQSSGISVDNPRRFTAGGEDRLDISDLPARERRHASDRCDPRLVKRLSVFASASAGFAVAVGVLGLAGWELHIALLDTWGAPPVRLAPNAAAGCILLGVALWLLRKEEESRQPFALARNLIARIAAAIVCLMGLLVLAEHSSGLDLGFDQLLFVVPMGERIPGLRPGLVASSAACAFILLSTALLLLDWKTRRGTWLAQYLSLASAMVAMFGILSLRIAPGVTGLTMAFPAAVSFLVLAGGLLGSRPTWAMGGLLASQSAGAKLLRKVVPLALLVLGLIGWLISKPLLTEAYFTWVQVSLLAIVCSALLVSFVTWIAFIVDRTDAERRKAEEALCVSKEDADRLLGRIEEPQAEAQLRRKVNVGFAVAVILTTLLGCLYWRGTQQAADDAAWVAHTHEVSTTLETILRHLVDVETGARGFALTGSEPFLEPYKTGKYAVAHDLQTLRLLVAENSDQQRRLETLQAEANARIESSTNVVAIRQNEGKPPTEAQLERGRQLMDAARATIAAMEDTERRLLQQRTQRARAATYFNISVAVLGPLMGVIFLSIAGVTVSREIGVSARARAQVNTLNAQLERRVAERTASLQSEIAERKRAERAQRSLSVCNESLMRATDESRLLNQICDLVVNVGGYRMAWVGYAERDEKKKVRPVAESGFEAGYLENANFTWADEVNGRGPVGTAVRFGEISVCHDTSSDPRFAPWRENAMKRGYRSCVALPLKSGEEVLGAIAVYATEAGAFNAAEQRLLAELANNLSYGIMTLRGRVQRKWAEDALRESEERFRALVTASSDVVYRMSPDWSEMRQLRGKNFLADTEAPNRNWLQEYIHPDDQARVTAAINEAIRTKSIFELAHHVLRADGSLGWTFSRAIPRQDANGEIVEWFGAASDITERRRAEDALQESERRYRLLFNEMIVGFAVLEAIYDEDENPCDFRYLEANSAFETHCGLSRDEAVGKTIREVLPGLDPFWIETYGKVATTGESVHCERYIELLERWLEVTAFRTRQGQVGVTFADVTERRWAEDALKQSLLASETMRKDLADQKFALDQHAIVAMTDVQGRITYANDTFCAISKYSREELLGQDHRILNSGHHPKEFFQNMYHTIGNGKVWHGKIKNRAKDGSIYWVDTTIVPFVDAHGKPRQYIAIRTDITENKRAEQLLADKAEELARSNLELEQFAYVASHDLQEPLRMVASYTQLLSERYGGKLDENADKFLGYAREGALRMQVLIQDLLAFSRVMRAGVTRKKLDSNAAFEEAVQSLAAAIAENGAFVTHTGLPMVWADQTQIAQVFQNLIGNAIKFRRQAPPQCAVSAEKSGSDWLFSVRDNGIGIPPEYAENIFVVFQRLHARNEYPGNGIGLAICKKIVEHYGGRIWVESQVGQGSTFKFTLPASASTQEGCAR